MNLLLKSLFFFLPILAAHAQDLNKGLIAWYKFDGNARDASDNANHGLGHNLEFSTGKCGQPNSAIYLNGRNAYIDLPRNNLLNTKQLVTITAWIKPIRFNNIQHTLKSVYAQWIGYGAAGPVGVLFGVGADSSVVGAFSAGYQVSSNANMVRSNEWQLIALLYNGTRPSTPDRALFQVNCQERQPDCNDNYSTCSQTPTSIGSLAEYAYIGVRKNNTGTLVDYFEGYVDDLRIYNRVLTKDELNQLFFLCGPPSCDDTNCLTEDFLNPNTCLCEYRPKPEPDCNDNDSTTEDRYNSALCTCEHKKNPDDQQTFSVHAPSAFSPNQDGVNDLFTPVYQGVNSLTITIYNRWGEVIFLSSGLNSGWDGTYLGRVCIPGAYQYKIDGSYNNGEIFLVKGTLMLIK